MAEHSGHCLRRFSRVLLLIRSILPYSNRRRSRSTLL
jgi:hypothetical protein